MRILDETEKKYTSVFMYQESFKADFKYINNHYSFKYKKDFISPTLVIIGLVLLILGGVFVSTNVAIGIIFLSIGVISFLIGGYFYKKYLNKRKVAFLDFYEKAIIQNGKIKHPDAFAISALYPIYITCDNNMKTVKVTYQDKDYMFFEYDDLLNYRILIDKVEFKSTRLPEQPDPRIRSYILEITFNNKKKGQIGFSNETAKFKLNGKFVFAQYANTKAINEIAKICDKIIKKNKV